MPQPSRAALFPRLFKAPPAPIVPVERVRPVAPPPQPPENLDPTAVEKVTSEMLHWQDYYHRTLPGALPEGLTFTKKLDALAYVAARWRVTIPTLTGESRAKYNVSARREAAYVLVRLMGYSYSEAGRILHRDHTSIMNLVEQYDKIVAERGALDA
jgi:hypothetical protein